MEKDLVKICFVYRARTVFWDTRFYFCLKVELSPSKKNSFNYFNKGPLKTMKKAFYFILKALFAIKIFEFFF